MIKITCLKCGEIELVNPIADYITECEYCGSKDIIKEYGIKKMVIE